MSKRDYNIKTHPASKLRSESVMVFKERFISMSYFSTYYLLLYLLQQLGFEVSH